MNRHPGGEEQTIHLLKSIELKKGMKALDLGAGEGETVRIMKAFGLNVQGVDFAPRSSEVQQGDFLTLQYAADSMDLCISQCAFFVSRDQKKAVYECWRVLKKGGFVLLSDLDPGNLLEIVKETGNRHENIYNVSNITGCNALIIFIDLLRQRIRNIVFLILEDVHPVRSVTLNPN